MGTKYSSVAISGFNASPPADDGTVADSNKVQWQKHLDKIGTPIKTAVESINTALVTALDQSSTSTTATLVATAAHHNRMIEIASSVSTVVTITLSDAATMAAGYVVTIHNLSAVEHTLGRTTGGDTINGTATNVPIAPYSQIKAWVNASANGYLTSVAGTSSNIVQTICKRKTSSESVTSSTSLQDDNHLSFAIAANEEWCIEFKLSIEADLSTTGFKYSVSVPSGATCEQDWAAIGGGNNVQQNGTFAAPSYDEFLASAALGSDAQVRAVVWVLNGATPGNVTLQWCQSTSSGTAVTINRGSYMVAYRVA